MAVNAKRIRCPLLLASILSIVGLTSCYRAGSPEADPPEPVSVVLNSLGLTFPNGLNENRNPYLDYIKERTNLDIRVIVPPSEGYEVKLNALMASGNPPDMLSVFSDVWVANYAKSGLLQPLNDWIDRYGSALKAGIPKEAWDKVTLNGNIYAIPSINEIRGTELMYARKDWLDKLGLKPPQTLEQYYEVIRAFTRSGPAGSGKPETHGLTLIENLGRSSPFFGAFGVQLGQWLERDGKLVYADILPETKEALTFLHRLYAEQLLDPEFPINKNRNLEKKIASGQVGLLSATWYDTRGTIELNRKNDPQAEWIPLDYPVGPAGHKGTYETSLIRQYQVVPAHSLRAGAVIRMLNFIAGEGNRELKLGFRNQVWSERDGRIVTDFTEHDKHLYRGMYSSLVDLPSPALLKERLDSLGPRFQLYSNVQAVERNIIRDEFQGPPTPAMEKYKKKLSALRDVYVKMIVGVIPLDRFESYTDWWRREGGDEITKEVNEWYQKQREVVR